MKVLFFIWILAVTGLSQDISVADAKRAEDRDKPVVVKDYDKFRDFTLVYSDYRSLTPSGHTAVLYPNIRLRITCSFTGEKVTPPILYSVDFRSESGEMRFFKSHGLILLVDGERLSFPDGQYSNDVMKTGGFRETVTFYPAGTVFEQLIAAKTVELQLGFMETALQPIHIRQMKAILETCK